MIRFPTLVPNCNWNLSLFLVHLVGQYVLRITRVWKWTNMSHQISCHAFCIQQCFLNYTSRTKKSLVGLDRARELTFCYELGSHSDATCEKIYKSLAGCIKQTQKLTLPDIWCGIILNWMKTWTEYPVELPLSSPCLTRMFWPKCEVIFHYKGGKCRHGRTGALLGWERVENTVSTAWHPSFALLWGDSVGSLEELTQPINSSFQHCMSRNYRTDV